MKKNKSRYERMIKTRRVMAMIGVIIIILLYVYFFALAARNDPNMQSALFAAFAATIIVPVIMYAFSMLAKIAQRNAESEEDTESSDEHNDI